MMKRVSTLLILLLCLTMALPAQAASQAERVLFREGTEAFLALVSPEGIR